MANEAKAVSVLFAAGGTGGHLFPAIAIAEEVRKLRPDARIAFVGTKEKIEARVVPQKGFEFHTIWISGLHRRLTIGNLLFPVKVVVSFLQSFFLIRKLKPTVVVGTGGYVCGPVLFAATFMKIPSVVHESNSYPGITTRMVAAKVSRVFITFEVTKRWLPKVDAAKIELVGNPTREVLGTVSREEGAKQFGLSPSKKTLLVFGGSLGAASINAAMENMAGALVAGGLQIIWQTGEVKRENDEQMNAVDVWKGMFIEKMECAYAAADLVMCRSGATTIAELTRVGKPAILVPYPFAAANHQELNAQAMVESGAACMIKDSELSSKAQQCIQELISDNEILRTMSEKSLKLGRRNAGRQIAEKILLLSNQQA